MKGVFALCALFALLLIAGNPVSGFGTLCGTRKSEPLTASQRTTLTGPKVTAPNLKVAFLGDVGNKDTSEATLKLAKEFGAELVVIGGDFDYVDDPAAWDDLLDRTLGDRIHVLAVMGNHDMLSWSPVAPNDPGKGYGIRLGKRMSKTGIDKFCVGLDEDNLGIKTACNYKGLQILLSGVGTWGEDHDLWMEDVFSETESIWRVCDFHKVQHDYQIGLKLDETGWGVYQTCLRHGAILATHHEHSYARTKNMADFKGRKIANEDATLKVKPGQSFAFVSGLGGYQVRPHYGGEQNPWWAKTAARQDEIRAAVLLCEFHIQGDPRKAHCDYVDQDRRRWDAFDIQSENPVSGDPVFPPQEQPQTSEEECEDVHLELPILSGQDDLSFRSTPAASAAAIVTAADFQNLDFLTSESPQLTVSPEESVLLRFPGLEYRSDRWPGLSESGLSAAHLQLKGIAGEGPTKLRIRVGSLGGQDGQSLEAVSSGFLEWGLLEDEADWEEEEVWVSPDLSPLLRELPNLRGGIALILTLPEQVSGEGTWAPRVFHSHDSSPCFAPHLTLDFSAELSGVCQPSQHSPAQA